MCNLIKQTFLLVILAGLISLMGCEKERTEEVSELKPTEEMSYASSDYVSLMEEIGALEQAVREESTQVEVRMRLVAASVDTAQGILFSVGYGKPRPDSRSEALALQSAERAALVDAYRWAAYILRWKEDPKTPDFGAIQAGVPGGRVVHKKILPDNEVLVLLELNTP